MRSRVGCSVVSLCRDVNMFYSYTILLREKTYTNPTSLHYPTSTAHCGSSPCHPSEGESGSVNPIYIAEKAGVSGGKSLFFNYPIEKSY